MKKIEDFFFTVTKILSSARSFLSTARNWHVEHVRHTFFCWADDVFLSSRWHFWKSVEQSRFEQMHFEHLTLTPFNVAIHFWSKVQNNIYLTMNFSVLMFSSFLATIRSFSSVSIRLPVCGFLAPANLSSFCSFSSSSTILLRTRERTWKKKLKYWKISHKLL